jgi:tetratricopeptide (TPR) repeat protein
MYQRNDNFIDKTFTIAADILLKIFPASKQDKAAFYYYRGGLAAQSQGDYAEALENYYEALQLEEDWRDRSFILYNIGLVYASNGEYVQALGYYQQALELNSGLTQALNNVAIIYHYQGTQAIEKQNNNFARNLFDKAGEYWRQAIRLAPDNYIEAQNWLKTTGRVSSDLLY